jgi:phage/plasmid-like protein (TIGR03299 family)
MAHLVEKMAFVGEVPWHGLGSKLSPGQSIEKWQSESGLDFEIRETDVLYSVSGGDGLHLKSNPDAKVLFRSDTLAPLSVVSKRYVVVQPKEILDFYRSLVSVGGFELETAGVLKGGRKLWALAKTNQETTLKGNDRIKAYLLLATSCDGSLATTAMFTSVRTVCSNTLQIALSDANGQIRVPHSTSFDPAVVKKQLGLGLSAWDSFVHDIKVMSERKLNKFEAMNYLVKVLGDPDVPLADQPNQKALQSVHALFQGQGKGSELQAANGTVWGLLNACTEYVDQHRRARSNDYRMDSAWFGQGAAIKDRAFQEALRIAA